MPDVPRHHAPGTAMRSSGSVADHAVNVVAAQLLAAVQEAELDQKGQADNLAAQLLDQVDSGAHGAARRQQVVYQQDALTRADGVAVYLEDGAAVLQVVFDVDLVGGEFAVFAHRGEAQAQITGDRGAEDEAARLQPHHDIDLAVTERRGHGLYRFSQTLRIA